MSQKLQYLNFVADARKPVKYSHLAPETSIHSALLTLYIKRVLCTMEAVVLRMRGTDWGMGIGQGILTPEVFSFHLLARK